MALPANTTDSTPESTPTSDTLATTVAVAPLVADGLNIPSEAHAKGMEDGIEHASETEQQHHVTVSDSSPQTIDTLPVPVTLVNTVPGASTPTHQHSSALESAQTRQTVEQLGTLVTEAASALVLDDRRWRSARRTQLRQHDDLIRFARFLAELAAHAGLPFTDPASYAERLATDLGEWQSITWGHVQAHMAWMLDCGYAIGTIDNALSTLKVYARLAQRAGALAADDLTRILDLHPFGYRGGMVVDDHRPADKRRRPGAKKGQPTAITPEEAQILKTFHPDNPRGRRDALLLTLLIDHGLRVGEVVALRLEDIDGLEGIRGVDEIPSNVPSEPGASESNGLNENVTGTERGTSRTRGRHHPRGALANMASGIPPIVLLRVHRPKVKKEQRHALTPDCVVALRRYLEVRRTVEPATSGALLCATHPHHPALVVAGMTENGIHKRVKWLGRELLGVEDLGPHDLRHFWATSAARGKTPFDRLVRAGGWNSPAMPLRYIDAEEVANTGVVLDHLRQATITPQHLSRRGSTQQ